MNIHSLLHVPFEDTGYIQVWAEQNGHSLSETRLYSGEKLPAADSYDLLIVMGGTMNIHEEETYPWLAEEKEYLKTVINSGKNVLGICLGAQLIASVLGAEVTRHTLTEIGWFDVEKTADAETNTLGNRIPDRFTAFQWHGDTFAIPDGAVHLFTGAGCKNQGFLYGNNVLALQFHLEITGRIIRNLIEDSPDETAEVTEYVQSIPQILDDSHYAPAYEIMACILEWFEENTQ
jgi:GMP synthase-like glutamine amidotransferase